MAASISVAAIGVVHTSGWFPLSIIWEGGTNVNRQEGEIKPFYMSNAYLTIK